MKSLLILFFGEIFVNARGEQAFLNNHLIIVYANLCGNDYLGGISHLGDKGIQNMIRGILISGPESDKLRDLIISIETGTNEYNSASYLTGSCLGYGEHFWRAYYMFLVYPSYNRNIIHGDDNILIYNNPTTSDIHELIGWDPDAFFSKFQQCANDFYAGNISKILNSSMQPRFIELDELQQPSTDGKIASIVAKKNCIVNNNLAIVRTLTFLLLQSLIDNRPIARIQSSNIYL